MYAMEQPLGRAVGNALEVEEAIKTLRGEGPADLEELCLVLGGQMLCLAGKVPDPARGSELLKGLLGGAALNKFKELIAAQHGDARVADDPSLLPQAPVRLELPSPAAGFVQRIRAESIGRSAMLLGAGRETKEDTIDPAAGIVLLKKAGDAVKAGEPWRCCTPPSILASPRVEQARRMALEAYEIDAPRRRPLPDPGRGGRLSGDRCGRLGPEASTGVEKKKKLAPCEEVPAMTEDTSRLY